ncbi:hypothetical protein EDB89DRAFT_1525209 [Lactarius sanguifluus]|nr:hypothetical protein EDB89DRAFT_1525209 [Lactarius sanguifluus]
MAILRVLRRSNVWSDSDTDLLCASGVCQRCSPLVEIPNDTTDTYMTLAIAGTGTGLAGEAAQPVRALFLACHPAPVFQFRDVIAAAPRYPRLYAMTTTGRSTALANPRSSKLLWSGGVTGLTVARPRRGSRARLPRPRSRLRPPTWSRRVGEFCSALPLCRSPLALLRLADSKCVRRGCCNGARGVPFLRIIIGSSPLSSPDAPVGSRFSGFLLVAGGRCYRSERLLRPSVGAARACPAVTDKPHLTLRQYPNELRYVDRMKSYSSTSMWECCARNNL